MTPEERGKRVAGLSDQNFGHVAEVAHGKFLLRTDDGNDYWLSQECVYLVDDNRVTLICERHSVERYAAEPPAETPMP